MFISIFYDYIAVISDNNFKKIYTILISLRALIILCELVIYNSFLLLKINIAYSSMP